MGWVPYPVPFIVWRARLTPMVNGKGLFLRLCQDRYTRRCVEIGLLFGGFSVEWRAVPNRIMVFMLAQGLVGFPGWRFVSNEFEKHCLDS